MPTDAPRPRHAAAGPLALGGAFIAGVLILVTRGHEEFAEGTSAAINALVLIINGGLLAAAYALAGMGLGRPLVHLLRRIPGVREAEETMAPAWLQAVAGVGLILWVSHALGMMGLLSGGRGLWVSWGVVALGLLLLADQIVRGPLRPEKWSALPVWAVLGAPGLAVLFVAACSPPTSLWLGARSEGGGYDVMSYHLQLPKEWIEQGSRLWPVEHNVYSYLPGYMEAAFLHIGAMARGGLPEAGSFVAGSGLGVIASQMLHAWMGVLTALLIARAVIAAGAARTKDATGSLPSVVAGATVLSIPWVIVVGSLAYNELGVTAMLAGAVLISMERSWSAAARGAGVGLFVGIACSVKPTSLFLAAPTAGLVLLFAQRQSVRHLAAAAGAGCITGLIAIVPWLARNWMASGNPVFPFGAGIFGNGHWTDEQLARYGRAHAYHGSIGDRLALLFDADRGILNEQWAILFPMGVLALAAVLIRPAGAGTRRFALLLMLGFVSQVLAWLFLTHLQSRFLLPAIVPLAIAIGLAVGELMRWVMARTSSHRTGGGGMVRLAMVVGAIVPLSLAAWSWLIFLSQRAGHPNQVLAAGGVEALTGQAFAAEFAQMQPMEREHVIHDLAPAPYINYSLGPDEAVYFMGGATPLYYIPAGGAASIVYQTTWDRNPLGEAMRAHPDDPAAWTAGVRAASRGLVINFVLADVDEYSRLYPLDPNKDIWFDPAVTPDRLRRWLSTECELVQEWRPSERGGMFLFRLKRGGS